MYRDVINKSKPVYLFVPAALDADQNDKIAQGDEAPYSSVVTESGEVRLVYTVNVDTCK